MTVVIDKSDPSNIINLLPARMAEMVEVMYQEHPEYLNASEEMMFEITKPDSRTEMLRIAFWEEYFRAKNTDTKIRMNYVFGGIIHATNWNRHFISNQKRLAWLMTPMTERMLSYKASLDQGRRTLRSLLSMKITDKKGNVDPKLAQVFLKAYEMLEGRVHGAVVQRIDQRTQNIPVPKEVDSTEKRVEDIQEKLMSALSVEMIEESKDG